MGNKLAAEFIGTFWLVLGGCGSAVLAAFLLYFIASGQGQALGQLRPFWVAPIIGAVVGAVAYKAVGGNESS